MCMLTSDGGKDSRIVHNNWIINNQVLKEVNSLKNQKQNSGKSVIVVKPNHALQNSDNPQPNRNSVKKASSERKPEKE